MEKALLSPRASWHQWTNLEVAKVPRLAALRRVRGSALHSGPDDLAERTGHGKAAHTDSIWEGRQKAQVKHDGLFCEMGFVLFPPSNRKEHGSLHSLRESSLGIRSHCQQHPSAGSFFLGTRCGESGLLWRTDDPEVPVGLSRNDTLSEGADQGQSSSPRHWRPAVNQTSNCQGTRRFYQDTWLAVPRPGLSFSLWDNHPCMPQYPQTCASAQTPPFHKASPGYAN